MLRWLFRKRQNQTGGQEIIQQLRREIGELKDLLRLSHRKERAGQDEIIVLKIKIINLEKYIEEIENKINPHDLPPHP